MESNNKKSLVPTTINGIVRVDKSIQITNKILKEIENADIAWWASLSDEWKKEIYTNYIIKQKMDSDDYISFDYEKEFDKIELDDIEWLDQRVLEDILQQEDLTCYNIKSHNYSPLNKFENLNRLSIDSVSMRDLSQIKKALKGLRYISLENTKISNIEVISEASQLQIISLSYSNVVDISPLRYLKNLTGLNICGTKVVNLKPLIRLNKTLDSLSIENCNIGNESIETLKHFNLRYLNVSGTIFSDLSFIKNYSKLNFLMFQDTKINDLSPSYHLKKLIQLECMNTPLTEEQIEKFRKINPSCKIYVK